MAVSRSEIRIKKVEPNDIPLMVKHRMKYLAELQGPRDHAFQDKLKAGLEGYFRTAIRENRFVGFMAIADETAVSFGGMIIKEIPGDSNKTSYLEGEILNMYTVPEKRRQGISSLILEALLSEAKQMGISKVALHTSKDGEKLYRNYGFSEPVYPYLELVLNTENFTH